MQVAEINVLTHNVKEVLKLIPSPELGFIAGQYIAISSLKTILI